MSTLLKYAYTLQGQNHSFCAKVLMSAVPVKVTDALPQRTYLPSLVLCTVDCLQHILSSVVIFQGIYVDKIHLKSFNTFSSYGCYCYSPL